MSMPATIASTDKTIETVGETLIFSNGNKPVRMSQIPNRSIPKFRLPKLSVSFIGYLLIIGKANKPA